MEQLRLLYASGTSMDCSHYHTAIPTTGICLLNGCCRAQWLWLQKQPRQHLESQWGWAEIGNISLDVQPKKKSLNITYIQYNFTFSHSVTTKLTLQFFGSYNCVSLVRNVSGPFSAGVHPHYLFCRQSGSLILKIPQVPHPFYVTPSTRITCIVPFQQHSPIIICRVCEKGRTVLVINICGAVMLYSGPLCLFAFLNKHLKRLHPWGVTAIWKKITNHFISRND